MSRHADQRRPRLAAHRSAICSASSKPTKSIAPTSSAGCTQCSTSSDDSAQEHLGPDRTRVDQRHQDRPDRTGRRRSRNRRKPKTKSPGRQVAATRPRTIRTRSFARWKRCSASWRSGTAIAASAARFRSSSAIRRNSKSKRPTSAQRRSARTARISTPQQQADLNKLAERQRELARRFDKTQQQMTEMAARSKRPIRWPPPRWATRHSKRPSAASAARCAKAAGKLDENQVGQADEQQQQVRRELDELLDILSNRREQELVATGQAAARKRKANWSNCVRSRKGCARKSPRPTSSKIPSNVAANSNA